MHRHRLQTGIGVTLALTLVGCHSNQVTIIEGTRVSLDEHSNKATETVKKQFGAQKIVTLRVQDDAGNIRVTAGDDTNGVALRAEKVIEGDRPVAELETYLARVQANTHIEGDTLVVKAEYPRDEFSKKRLNVAVNYVITIPQRLALDLLSHAGNVEAKGAKGGVLAQSNAGNVTLADVAGTIESASDAGDVSVKDAAVRGLLKLDSGAGNVRAEAIHVSGPRLNVLMKSSSGNVDFTGDAGELNLHSGSGNVTGKVTTTLTLSRAYLQSNSGNVALTASKALSATIHAKTDAGNIRVHGTPVIRKSLNDDGAGQSLDLTLGGGRASVTLETNAGNVEFSVR